MITWLKIFLLINRTATYLYIRKNWAKGIWAGTISLSPIFFLFILKLISQSTIIYFECTLMYRDKAIWHQLKLPLLTNIRDTGFVLTVSERFQFRALASCTRSPGSIPGGNMRFCRCLWQCVPEKDFSCLSQRETTRTCFSHETIPNFTEW